MCAQIFAECYVTRLVEGAGEVACLQRRPQNGCRIARVGTQIAIAKISSRKKRWAARQIDKNITTGYRSISATAEFEHGARGGAGRRIVVDGDFESAEIAFGGTDRALHHGKLGHAQWRELRVWLDQDGDVELVFEQVGRFDDLLVPAVKQRDPLACQRNKGNVRC